MMDHGQVAPLGVVVAGHLARQQLGVVAREVEALGEQPERLEPGLGGAQPLRGQLLAQRLGDLGRQVFLLDDPGRDGALRLEAADLLGVGEQLVEALLEAGGQRRDVGRQGSRRLLRSERRGAGDGDGEEESLDHGPTHSRIGPMARSPWRPLLQGDLAARALQAVDDITAALDSLGPSVAEPRGASLAGGAAGLALYHAYLSLHSGEERQADRAADLLETAAEALASTVMAPGLYGGFAGVAWTVEHLQGRLFEPDPDEDPNLEIDEALLSFLGSSNEPDEYDLISGFTGIGVYARERLPRPSGAALLEKVVERLAAQAETGPEGTTWFTDPLRLPEWQRVIHPAGLYNLGVAHGMPAVVALLAAACAAGVAAERARPLLDGAVAWLLAHRLAPGSGSCFSSSFYPGSDAPPSRLAWCYGDPGIAATLLLAAQATGEPAWEAEARAIAQSTVERPATGAGIRDPGICHGSAGLAHLYNRLWQSTGEEAFAEAARFWFERSLELRTPDEGIAGFQAWRMGDPGSGGHWEAEPGFLEGATGVGLALLAAASTVEPEWDRILLLS